MTSITYREVTDFSSPELDPLLAIWSEITIKEQKLLSRSVDFFRKNLLHAVFAFSDETLVGMSGIVPCPDRHGKPLYHEDRLIAELGGRYFDPSFRGREIGPEMILRRLRFARDRNYFPISVTADPAATKTFKKMGAYEMTHDYGFVYKEIRVCECIQKHCPTCPRVGRSIWVLDHILDQQEASSRLTTKQAV